MRNAPSNSDDTIDSRDVIARIEELEDERSGWPMDDDGEDSIAQAADWTARNADDAAELKALQALAEEGEGSPDWRHGETLIRESYFTRYAQDLADDIGAIDHNASWPNTCIDWDRAARELQMDYSAVDFDGVTYFIRA